MNYNVSRLRMFAGPNGSGKSTLKELLAPELLGIYINPDEIEKEIKQFDFLDFRQYEVKTTAEEILSFMQKSTLLAKANLQEETEYLKYNDYKLIFTEVAVNAYFASVCADFIRQKLLEQRTSFTFETVMSAPDKIAVLKTAQKLGYRTYLYFIATADPLINISRVQNRVLMGGHNVPEDKIISRYHRSIDYLWSAIQHTNRAYIFDNSNIKHAWLQYRSACYLTELDYEKNTKKTRHFDLNNI